MQAGLEPGTKLGQGKAKPGGQTVPWPSDWPLQSPAQQAATTPTPPCPPPPSGRRTPRRATRDARRAGRGAGFQTARPAGPASGGKFGAGWGGVGWGWGGGGAGWGGVGRGGLGAEHGVEGGAPPPAAHHRAAARGPSLRVPRALAVGAARAAGIRVGPCRVTCSARPDGRNGISESCYGPGPANLVTA